MSSDHNWKKCPCYRCEYARARFKKYRNGMVEMLTRTTVDDYYAEKGIAVVPMTITKED